MQKHKRSKDKARVSEEVLLLHDEIETDKWLAQFASDIEAFEELYPDHKTWHREVELPEGITLIY